MALCTTGEAVSVRNQIRKQLSRNFHPCYFQKPSQVSPEGSDLQVHVVNTKRTHKVVSDKRSKKVQFTVHHEGGSQRKKSNTSASKRRKNHKLISLTLTPKGQQRASSWD